MRSMRGVAVRCRREFRGKLLAVLGIVLVRVHPLLEGRGRLFLNVAVVAGVGEALLERHTDDAGLVGGRKLVAGRGKLRDDRLGCRGKLRASSLLRFVDDFDARDGGVVHDRLKGDVKLALRGGLQVRKGLG